MSPSLSLARQFFDNIRTAPHPVAFIRGLVNSNPPTCESDWLDFKQQPRPSDLTNPKWREIWAEALSGFSNNQGGVLILGLDAREDKSTGIDAVRDVTPVSNPFGVKSRLIELQRQATDPVVMNVEIEAYEGAPGLGFVVCYIPEGNHKPYRTEDGRRSQFYLRTADNFVPMSRSILASLFYPRTRVRFRAVANLTFRLVSENSSDTGRVVCHMVIKNDGTATASEMFVRVTWKVPGEKLSMNTVGGECWSNEPTEYCFWKRVPLHPGFEAAAFNAKWKLPQDVIARISDRGHVPGDTPPYIRMAIFAENQEPQTVEVPFDLFELVTKEKLTVEATAG